MKKTEQNYKHYFDKTEIMGFSEKDDLMLPAYSGGSILNIPSTLCDIFQIPQIGAQAINPDWVDPKEYADVKRVILVLMDGLKLSLFQKWIEEKKTPIWKNLQQQGKVFPLTSIVPSTTCAAMTSLWTGKSPAEHGVAGYELWLKEYSVVGNMILQGPATFANARGSLEKAGFEPENAIPVKKLGTHLLENGVKTYAFQHYSIANSGLSRSYFHDVDTRSFSSYSDLWVTLRDHISSHLQEKMYIWTYFGDVDGLMHRFGPDDERVEAQFISFSDSFEKYFINKLSPEERENTLLILTADHGQIFTPKLPQYDLTNHPEFLSYLHIKPTCENRLTYLHLKPDCKEKVTHYIETNWPGDFYIHDSAELLKAGLFGGGEVLPEMFDRAGDLTLIARNSAYLWWAGKENVLLGRHGGLSAQEMTVPFLITKL